MVYLPNSERPGYRDDLDRRSVPRRIRLDPRHLRCWFRGRSTGAENLLQTNVATTALSVFTRTTFNVTECFSESSVCSTVATTMIPVSPGSTASRCIAPPRCRPVRWIGTPRSLVTTRIEQRGIPLSSSTSTSRPIGIPELKNGTNVLAVGVWNINGTSSDLVLVPNLTANGEISLTRGPYLQQGTEDSMVLRWRTKFPTDTQVHIGPSPGSLVAEPLDPTLKTEHIYTVQKSQRQHHLLLLGRLRYADAGRRRRRSLFHHVTRNRYRQAHTCLDHRGYRDRGRQRG